MARPYAGTSPACIGRRPRPVFHGAAIRSCGLRAAIAHSRSVHPDLYLPRPIRICVKDDIFDITSLGIHDVNRVRGNAISEPVYLLRGMVSSQDEDFITLKTNKEELRITGLLSVREILVIDSGLLTAKITDLDGNMLRNGLSILQRPNFPTLNKGTNTVDISVNGATFTELVIHAKSRWR